jgi:hypothetical protein
MGSQRGGAASNPSRCVRGLPGLQEFDDGVLIRAGQLSEAFGDVASFAAVSEDGVGEGKADCNGYGRNSVGSV